MGSQNAETSSERSPWTLTLVCTVKPHLSIMNIICLNLFYAVYLCALNLYCLILHFLRTSAVFIQLRFGFLFLLVQQSSTCPFMGDVVQYLFLLFSDCICGSISNFCDCINLLLPLFTSKYPVFLHDLIIFTGHGLFGTILSMTSCFWSVSPFIHMQMFCKFMIYRFH